MIVHSVCGVKRTRAKRGARRRESGEDRWTIRCVVRQRAQDTLAPLSAATMVATEVRNGRYFPVGAGSCRLVADARLWLAALLLATETVIRVSASPSRLFA